MSTTNSISDGGNIVEGEAVEEIYAWIDQIQFSRPKKIIARDFSDAVLMAELLKKYYPRYVDVHNYIAGNSIAKKIDNWATLNRKVLSKLDMKLSKEVIGQLANSQQGAIERVLSNLRAKILKDCNAERDSLYFDYEENGRGGKNGDADRLGETVRSLLNPDEVANKTVPRQVFTKLKMELQEKNEAINTLNHKVSHLESLMKLKDQRISDLTAQVINPQESSISNKSHLLGSGVPKSRNNKV
ncbi:sperm flagellar protein 1-like [Diprion similis]|uniref:sperm flagellar protein 1-like n=1 Tax=Diprion similis TaxID=362088 RepID=UPI001EF942E5|nr:sperm flagellar protein 1-like [Diprion similis]